MFTSTDTVVGAAVAPSRVKDNAYVFGHHGFLYTARHAVSAETKRHPGVVLVTADRSDVEITLRDGRCFRAAALAIAPRVARRLRADDRALLSFNVLPSSRWFHGLRTLRDRHDVAILDRDGFGALDTRFQRLYQGDASVDLAASVFENTLAEAHRQIDPPSAADPVLLGLLQALDDDPSLPPEALAERCGRPLPWVLRALAEELGMPLADYRHWLRQRRVLGLLYSRRSLTQVALEGGFVDSPQLSRTFQRWYGQSPSFSRNPNHVRLFIDRQRTAPAATSP